MSRLVSLFALLLCLAAPAGAALAQQTPQPTLKVATRVLPPFVTLERNNTLDGFSIELWRALARDLNIKFDFVVKSTVTELLKEIADKQADVGIAAISITAERENAFDFSQPMFDAGLQIMIDKDRSTNSGLAGFWSLLKSGAVLDMLGLLLILILLPTPFIYWIERRGGSSGVAKGSSPVAGYMNTVWWSASTLGAQAPSMPERPLGKVVAV